VYIVYVSRRSWGASRVNAPFSTKPTYHELAVLLYREIHTHMKTNPHDEGKRLNLEL